MNIKDSNCYKDSRGKIQMVLETCQVGSISIIESEPGSRRAGHYHQNGEGHWVLVTEGQITMYERPTGTNLPPKKIVVNKGDLWFTGSNIDHLMVFDVFTIFHCYSVKARDSKTYESDTVRLSPDDNLDELYAKHEIGVLSNLYRTPLHDLGIKDEN